MVTPALDLQRAFAPLNVFISYAHEDETLKEELLKHLSALRRRGIIAAWHDRIILPGADWAKQIDSHLESSQIILLLVSPDFLASDYCYDMEMTRALERHRNHVARVIPIFLRPCDWKGMPFEHLQGLPLDARPVTKWPNPDEAFETVAQGIRIIAESFQITAEAVISEKRPLKVELRLIEDHKDDDLLRALLVLYEDRIPENERFDTADIVRWIREDEERTPSRQAMGSRNYFAVAKSGDEVCGFVLAHSYLRFGLVFVAYLVAKKGISIDSSTVSQKLADFVFELFDTDRMRNDYRGFILEVDDPLLARTKPERRRRLARIRLFYALAEHRGLQLRALDFDYRHPHVAIPRNIRSAQGLGLLLMFAGRSRTRQGWMGKPEVTGLLDFICNGLYPEGFSDVPEENKQYSAYTKALYRAQITNLPEEIRMLSLADIRSRSKRTKTFIQHQLKLNEWLRTESPEAKMPNKGSKT